MRVIFRNKLNCKRVAPKDGGKLDHLGIVLLKEGRLNQCGYPCRATPVVAVEDFAIFDQATNGALTKVALARIAFSLLNAINGSRGAKCQAEQASSRFFEASPKSIERS